MNDAESYWSPLCKLVSELRCWVRVAWREGSSTKEGDWGQMLIIPTTGYLEGPSGPMPFRDVEWVEVSTSRIKGGIAGRPLQFVDVKGEILAALGGTKLLWELRDSRWFMERVFKDEPVLVARVVNPFGPTPRL